MESNDNLKDKLFDDLIFYGECAWKTELEEGLPITKHVDPISPEMKVAIYNANNVGSAMQMHWQPTPEQSYDGSKLNYRFSFDPFGMKSVDVTLKNKRFYFDGVSAKDDFRMPRKLKKKIKKHFGGFWNKREMRFFLECFKMYKYYRCKALIEKQTAFPNAVAGQKLDSRTNGYIGFFKENN